MNYINISAGLGNQMFQYAFYLAYNLEHPMGARMFMRKISEHNGYELDRLFGLAYKHNLWTMFLKIPHTGKLMNIFLKTHKIFPVRHYQYQEEIMRTTYRNTFFDGYWQTEKYFKEHESEIRNAFTFDLNMLNAKSKHVLSLIKSNNSISVHVRRGDYKSSNFKNTLGAACTPEYYERTIRYMNEHVENPIFVFFSDDIQWVRDNIKVDKAIYVDHNFGIDSWQDMCLMSNCKHNIIANSSFSWWGAWLNDYIKKIVIAPKTWWGEYECPDVVPEKWFRV